MATGVNPFPAASYKAPDSQSLLFSTQRKKKNLAVS